MTDQLLENINLGEQKQKNSEVNFTYPQSTYEHKILNRFFKNVLLNVLHS